MSPATPSTQPERLSSTCAAAIRRRLLGWYDRHRRDLPWRRRAGDAYAQWVAEIMLQQTRVETVLDYYERFLDRFPDATTLGAARQQTVLKHWEGLGYYRRAIHLHEAAKQVRKAGGAMPTTLADLRRLPGIGEYTAAAIASIAYGIPAAAVDGNVCRVTARLAMLTEDMTTGAGRATATQVATQLLSKRRPGDFNQAMMDLGSAVCTPRSPRCDECPLRAYCAAAMAGQAARLPIRDAVRRRVVPEVRLAVVWATFEGRVLIHRQPRGGLWSGLWGFPSAESALAAEDTTCLAACVAAVGVWPVGPAVYLGLVEHRLTHRQLSFYVYRVAVKQAGEVLPKSWKWASRSELAKVSMSTAHRKIERLASA